jgi:inosose dehydratase
MFDVVAKAGLSGVEFGPEPADWRTALDAFGSAREIVSALRQRGLQACSAYVPGREIVQPALEEGREGRRRCERYMSVLSDFLSEVGGGVVVVGNLSRLTSGAANGATNRPLPPRDHADLQERYCSEVNGLGRIAGEGQVSLALHTDAYSLCSRPDDVAAVMRLTDPEHVGLCPDPAHLMLDGTDPVALLGDHIGRVVTIHWKDCTGALPPEELPSDRSVRHARMLENFRIMGSGVLDWDSWMGVLRDNKWRGWAIEELDHSPDPGTELRAGLDFFNRSLAAIYV